MPDRDINHLQPHFKEKVHRWFLRLDEAGIQLKITETLRTYERSAELYAQGRTNPGSIVTKAKAGQSYHNFGLAIDAYPIHEGKIVVDFDKHPNILAMVRLAANIALQEGILWGGNFATFRDLPHWQDKYAPSLADCRKRWPEGYKP